MKKQANKSAPDTISAIAAKVGRTRATIYDWKRQGAPVEDGAEAVLEWAMSNARKGQDPEAVRDAKLEVLKETARRLKIANDQKEDKLAAKPDVVFALNKGIAAMFSEMDRAFLNELPTALVGLSPLEIAAKCREAVERFRENFRKTLEQFMTEDDQAIAPSAPIPITPPR